MSGSPLAAPFVRRLARRPATNVRWHRLAVLQHLSLDVVAGVICGAMFAASVTGAAMPAAWWCLLPLATWVVYSTDRLIDARRAGEAAGQQRHRFYHRRAGVLTRWTAALGACGLVAGLVWFPLTLWPGAVAVAVAAVAHLGQAQRRRTAAKEFSAAAVYVAGIWFGPLLLAPTLDARMLLLAGLHAVAAAANLVAFSLFEEACDARDGQASIVIARGRRGALRVLRGLTLAGVVGVIGVALLAPGARPAPLIVLLLLIVLPATMVRHGESFAPRQRYRLVGDLAFVLLLFAA